MINSSPFAVSLVLIGSLAVAAPSAAQEPAGAMGRGTEGRMWVEAPLGDPTSPQRYDVEIVEHAKITMRDGVKLDGVLYLPKLPKPGPCILVADGYGWSFDRRDRRFAERGYAVANFSYRGIDQSEGDAGLYDHFGEDGYDMVEWMAKQPWCNGNVGMFGSSLPGIPLWLIALEAPPSLKAIAPDVACGDCYEYLWYLGGMLPGPGRESRERHEYVAAIEHRDFDPVLAGRRGGGGAGTARTPGARQERELLPRHGLPGRGASGLGDAAGDRHGHAADRGGRFGKSITARPPPRWGAR
jgi:hypothetical protein